MLELRQKDSLQLINVVNARKRMQLGRNFIDLGLELLRFVGLHALSILQRLITDHQLLLLLVKHPSQCCVPFLLLLLETAGFSRRLLERRYFVLGSVLEFIENILVFL